MCAGHQHNVGAGLSERGKLSFHESHESWFRFVRVEQVSCNNYEVDTILWISGEFHRLDPSKITTQSLLSLIYLILFGTLVTFTAYTWLLREIEPVIVGSYAFVNPIIAVFVGWFVGGESLDFWTLLGGMVIVTSVTVIHCYSNSSDFKVKSPRCILNTPDGS